MLIKIVQHRHCCFRWGEPGCVTDTYNNDRRPFELRCYTLPPDVYLKCYFLEANYVSVLRAPKKLAFPDYKAEYRLRELALIVAIDSWKHSSGDMEIVPAKNQH
jgi:hypothetical protein